MRVGGCLSRKVRWGWCGVLSGGDDQPYLGARTRPLVRSQDDGLEVSPVCSRAAGVRPLILHRPSVASPARRGRYDLTGCWRELTAEPIVSDGVFSHSPTAV